MIGKITLPLVNVRRSGSAELAGMMGHHPFFLPASYPLNAGWELFQHGTALVLSYKQDLAICISMGSFDWGSECRATASCAGMDEVAEVQEKLLQRDVPGHMDANDTPAIIQQFYNHIIFEALEAIVPADMLDTNSHLQV